MRPALIATPGGRPAADQPDAAAVLRAILRQGPLARTAIIRETGLSAAVVSRHAAELLAMGLVWEPPEPHRPPRPGRPRIPLDIETAHHVAAGVHIAVPRLTFSLTDLRGTVIAYEHVPRQRQHGAVLQDVAARLPGFLRRHLGGRSVLGLGVATGGWVDPDAGVLVENSALGWRDIPLRRSLQRAVGLPVHVEGHARALAQAELLFGANRGGDLVHLFVGNAVDAAIATGGVLLQGRRYGAGGIAHLPVPGSAEPCPCGRTGCLQATVSDRAVARRAVAEGVIPHPDLRLLVRAARAGDVRADQVEQRPYRVRDQPQAGAAQVERPDDLVLTEFATLRLPRLLDELTRELTSGGDQVRTGSFGVDTLAVAATAPVLAAVYQDPLGLRTSGGAR